MSHVLHTNELIAEVLSYLPIKSLMRFKCVCKSWKILVSDPIFIELHLQRSTTGNRHIAVIKCEQDYNVVTFRLSHLSENPLITITNNSYNRLKFRKNCRIVGSCNGLLCLVISSDYTYSPSVHNICIRVWNPATRTLSRKLGSFHHPFYSRGDRLSFAFGYDKLTRTYKVVLLSLGEGKVLNLGDNIWREMSSFPPFYLVPDHTLGSRDVNEGVYLSGTVNWISIDPEHITVEKFVIISVDLSTETYRQLLPPRVVDNLPPQFQPAISVLMDCLCFSHHLNDSHFVIWKMTEFGVEQSWTQFFKISYDTFHVDHNFNDWRDYLQFLFPLCISENGDTLILASRRDHAILYNVRDNKVEHASGDVIRWCHSKDYVESLASIC